MNFITDVICVKGLIMSGLFAFMILVSCSDGLQDCKVADDMLNAYPTAQYCERQLEPAVRKISLRGEQIFGRCMSADNDLAASDAIIYWQVDRKGDFLVEIRDESVKKYQSPIMSVWLNWMGASAA